jgi:hypothetical protein
MVIREIDPPYLVTLVMICVLLWVPTLAAGMKYLTFLEFADLAFTLYFYAYTAWPITSVHPATSVTVSSTRPSRCTRHGRRPPDIACHVIG